MRKSLRTEFWSSALLLGLLAIPSCADEPKQVRPTPKPYKAPVQTQTETPTVENTEERGEDIRKVCGRKAQTSPDISRCWMEESERRSGKKFEAEVKLMLLVSPEGQAQEVNVLTPQPEFKKLEECVVAAVKSWSFPTGQTVAPAQCNFLLRPIM